jgi:hypothetical protein
MYGVSRKPCGIRKANLVVSPPLYKTQDFSNSIIGEQRAEVQGKNGLAGCTKLKRILYSRLGRIVPSSFFSGKPLLVCPMGATLIISMNAWAPALLDVAL